MLCYNCLQLLILGKIEVSELKNSYNNLFEFDNVFILFALSWWLIEIFSNLAQN